jgi:uncharacterized protein (TIGR03435 family)
MRVAVLIILSLGMSFAQPTSSFDVASIKTVRPGDVRGSTFQFTPGGGLQVTNGTLRGIIQTASDVRDFQIIGGSGWLNAEHYDISAKGASGSIPGTRLMLLTLLSERFPCVARQENCRHMRWSSPGPARSSPTAKGGRAKHWK